MGPWGIAIALLVVTSFSEEGRRVLRKGARLAIKTGYLITEKTTTAIDDIKDKTSDVIAEIKAESGEDDHHPAKKHKAKKTAAVD
jgi:hypothetical protein